MTTMTTLPRLYFFQADEKQLIQISELLDVFDFITFDQYKMSLRIFKYNNEKYFVFFLGKNPVAVTQDEIDAFIIKNNAEVYTYIELLENAYGELKDAYKW